MDCRKILAMLSSVYLVAGVVIIVFLLCGELMSIYYVFSGQFWLSKYGVLSNLIASFFFLFGPLAAVGLVCEVWFGE